MLSSSLESSESSSSVLLSLRSLGSSEPCVLLEAGSRGESRDRSEDGGSGLGTETETDLLVRERAGDASTGDLSTASSKESCSVVYFVSMDVTPDRDAVCRVTAVVRQGGRAGPTTSSSSSSESSESVPDSVPDESLFSSSMSLCVCCVCCFCFWVSAWGGSEVASSCCGMASTIVAPWPSLCGSVRRRGGLQSSIRGVGRS